MTRSAGDPGSFRDPLELGDGPFPGLDRAERAELLRIGPIWNRDIVGHRRIVVDIFSRHAEAAGHGIEIIRDVAYGPHERHRVDVFRQPGHVARPVIAFVHGGAFTRGAKSVNGVIYDNLPFWFARRGYLAFNVEYRLAPDIMFPAGATDIADATTWIARHASEYGGDPERLALIGHSAGGSHIATSVLDPVIGVQPCAAIRALVLISARLRADVRPDNPNAANVAQYYGTDERRYAECSPLSHAARCRWPVLVAVAEYENRHLDAYGAEFALEVAKIRGVLPRFLQLRHHNHTSIVAHFGTSDDILGGEILDFLDRAGMAASVQPAGHREPCE